MTIAQGCILTPVVRNSAASGLFIDPRFRTQNEQDLHALLAPLADFGWWSGAATGSNLRGYSGAATDELGNYGGQALTAGSTSSIVDDTALAVDQYYAAMDGSADAAYTGDDVDWGPASATDVTWVHVLQLDSISGNTFICGQRIASSGERVLLYTNSNKNLIFNNKNTDSPSGTQDEISTANDTLVDGERVIVWVSNEGGGTPNVALGTGDSTTPLATAAWTNAVMRGGSKMQFGTGNNSSNAMTGRWYRSIRIPKFHTEIKSPRGTPVFGEIIDLLKTIYEIS